GWTISNRSAPCRLETRIGRFSAAAYELLRPTGEACTAVVIRHGRPRAGMVLRVNSACVTSEAFGDTSCDCARQLTATMTLCVSEGSGLVIYSPFEEGRGIGLFDKINSMALMQEQGLSSREAFVALGLPPDNRDFDYVAPILISEGVTSVRVVGRNRAKLE